MGKKGTLYLIYVDGSKLNPLGILRGKYDADYGEDSRFILYGATTDPKLLDEFFIFHKKEYFIVKSEKFKTKNITQLDLERKFSDVWLKYVAVGAGIWLNGKLKYTEIAMVLSVEEEGDIGYELEALDEFVNDFYMEIEIHQALYDEKVYTKDLMKVLHDLKLKKILSYVTSLYEDVIDRGLSVGDLHFNEWHCLTMMYGEVLIGGDKIEDSYF